MTHHNVEAELEFIRRHELEILRTIDEEGRDSATDHAVILHNQGVVNRNLMRVGRMVEQMEAKIVSGFDKTAADAADLESNVDKAITAITEGRAEIAAARQQITDLQNQLVAGGGAVTTEQLTTLDAGLVASDEKLAAALNPPSDTPAATDTGSTATDTAATDTAPSDGSSSDASGDGSTASA